MDHSTKTPAREIPTREESWYSQSDFTNGPCILSGRVVDEQGSPVRKFGLRVFLKFSFVESYLFEIEEPKGRFNLNCPQPIAGYIVQADSFALEQRGFLERTELAMPDTADQTVLLKRGLRISGSLELTKDHRKVPTLVLIDGRLDTYQNYWRTLSDEEREWSQQIIEQPSSFPSLAHVYQYRQQPNSDGDFAFENLQNGAYCLFVFYNDQLLTQKQIRLDSTNVAIEPIVVPPTGRIQGIVKEFPLGRMSPGSSPFPKSSINPFEIYVLSRLNSNSRKLFRGDHSGRFELDDILAGQYRVIAHKKLFRSAVYNPPFLVLNPPFLVSGGKVTEVDSDYAPILEIEIRNEDDNVRDRIDRQYVQADLLGSDGVHSIAWLGNPEETRNGSRRRLYGDKNLPNGRYHLQLPKGSYLGNLHTQFDYIKTDRTQAKEVSAHELSFNAPTMVHFVHEQLTCTISHKGVVVFEGWANSPMECIVEGAGPFDILLENNHMVGFSFAT